MVNLRDFDLHKFLLANPLELRSKDILTFEKACVDVARQRTSLCLIAPPGSGIESFIRRYKKQNPEEFFILNCRKLKLEEIFGDLMMELQFGHRLVNWYDTPLLNILEALIYYLNEINNRTLLFFNNCDYLKLPALNDLFFELKRFNGNTGIVYRITPDYGKKILKSPDVTLRSFLARSDRFELDYPTEDDLIAACHENGIVSESVTRNLVAKTFDFDVVSTRVEGLFREVKSSLAKNAEQKE